MATRGKKSAAQKARGGNAKKKAGNGRKSGSESRASSNVQSTSETAKSNGKVTQTGGGDFDLNFLRGLIEAIDKSGIDSVEIDREGTKVRLSKTPPAAAIMAAPMHAPMMQAAPAPAAPSHSPATAAAAPDGAVAPAAEAPKSNYTDVKSPMVGTFYRAPAPEAPSYVEMGSHVTKGQTLCILEAMKLMNEMESEVDGIVREILVDNGDPVEYGQVLFRIEPR